MWLRRLLAALAMAAGLTAGTALLTPAPASAHPLGNFTVNRYSGLDLSPGTIRVLYVLDMAEIPTYQEMPAIDANGDGTADEGERQAWADRMAPVLLSRVSLTVGGAPVALRVSGDSMRFRPGQAGLPILRFEGTFRASLRARTGSVEYRDENYSGRIGWKEITARSEPGLSLAGSSVPVASISRTLLAYPTDMLASPLDVTMATFSFRPGPGTSALPAAAAGTTVAGAPVASGGAFAGLIGWQLTPTLLALSVLLAFGFGALHALGPGHGKTITAAYLVGAGARRAQAMAIGVAVSLMHTASVLALGLVFLVLAKSFPPERVYPWLELATGVVALGLGAYLLVTRLRARRTGADPWHGHTHDQAGGHSHPNHDHGDGAEGATGSRAVTPRSLLALAVAGGILPSPTAFVVLLGAVRAHRIAYGLSLILAFSLGLAAALVFVGMFALRTRSALSHRMGGRWTSLIPVGSALVILGFGVFFASRGTMRLL